METITITREQLEEAFNQTWNMRAKDRHPSILFIDTMAEFLGFPKEELQKKCGAV